jgi:hypothetical protein
VIEIAVERRNGSAGFQDRDLLAVEEALAIHLVYGTAEQRVVSQFQLVSLHFSRFPSYWFPL